MVAIETTLFIVGIVFLLRGSYYLVEGASSLSKKLGISPLIIGLTIVAFGTSMPEFIVNIFAAAEGYTEVAFGNIVGSNLSNILLILGLTAFIFPINVDNSTTWKEIPFALLAVIVLFVISNKFMIDGFNIFFLSRVDGIILLFFFAIFLYYVFELAKRSRLQITPKELIIHKHKPFMIFIMLTVGVVGLYFGGKWVVDGAVYFAETFGFSQFVVSATIVALGTSLPELVTSLTAAFKKEVGLAIGNIVGSNVFNIFWILGVTSLIRPVPIPSFINVDLLILIAATFLLFLFMIIGKKNELERWEGAALMALYFLYITFVIWRG